MKVTVKWIGLKEFQATLKLGKKGLGIETSTALYASLKDRVLPRCVAATPLMTGELRKTVRVMKPEVVKRSIEGGITAGSETVDYAGYVHENLSARHAVGQAKYIEQPMREEAPFIRADVARRIDLAKAFGK